MRSFFIGLMLLLLMGLGFPEKVRAQARLDSLSDEVKLRMIDRAKHFVFGFYIDAYSNLTFGGKDDTSNVVPYSGNCPVQNQIRLNVAAIQIRYNADKVRGCLAVQYGDAPNLLSSPDVQFIKNLRQAWFGFRILKGFWVDAGYILNPVGYESSWPVLNQISTVTIGGYFQPVSLLGAKFSYKFSGKIDIGFMVGDPYSLAYGRNTRFAGVLFLNYYPVKGLHINYNNFWGNQALADAEINNNTLYNNLIVTWDPVKKVGVVGQFDWGFQTNAALPPDTTHSAGMFSGFIQAQYHFNDHFAVTARYEVFDDPNGFLSGTYSYDGHTRGLLTNGMTIGLEYKPVDIGYVRGEYRYLHANKGNKVFYSDTSDDMQSVVFTLGVFF